MKRLIAFTLFSLAAASSWAGLSPLTTPGNGSGNVSAGGTLASGSIVIGQGGENVITTTTGTGVVSLLAGTASGTGGLVGTASPTLSGLLTVNGNVSLTGNLTVGGNASFTGTVGFGSLTTNNLAVSGTVTGIVLSDLGGFGSGVKTWAATPSFSNLNSALTGDTLVGLAAAQALTGKKYVLTAAHASDDTYEGTTVAGLNAGATIAQWEIVYLGGSSTWLLADADGSGTYPACGISVAGYSSGNAATVLVRGTVRNDSWSWTPGGRIYMSTTAGGLTQTAPSTASNKVQDVGFAITADIAYFDFNGVYLNVATP